MLTNFAGAFPSKPSILAPASRRPCIQFAVGELESWVLMPVRPALTLAELEALSCALLAVFLAFSHARIASEKSVVSQSLAQIRIQNRKRPRKPHAHGACLPPNAAAIACCSNVQLMRGIRELQRLGSTHQPRDILEVRIHGPAVDFKFSTAWTDEHARHGVLAPAAAISLRLQNAFSRLYAGTQLSSSKSIRNDIVRSAFSCWTNL